MHAAERLIKSHMYRKLMRFRLTNRIVEDSDFMTVDFVRRLQSDSKSNDESQLAIGF